MGETGKMMRTPLLDGIRKEAQHILVTGVGGSGKSTLSRNLAQQLGRDHIDLDKVLRKGTWAYDIVQNTKKPSIIEGVQLLDEDPAVFKGHDIRLVDVPDKVLVERALKSGSWSSLPPDEQLAKIKEGIARQREQFIKFKKGM